MQTFRKDPLQYVCGRMQSCMLSQDAPQRAEVETFIQAIFAQHYAARVTAFAPNLVRFDFQGRMVAAAGWRCAADEPLFLEAYLDQPVEAAIARQTGRDIPREQIVEVGNLAVLRPGSSLYVITDLARKFEQLGYQWVVFTATSHLISIFNRLGLPLLALSKADPSRLGDAAQQWGSYYEENPIVVAGMIQIASTRLQGQDPV